MLRVTSTFILPPLLAVLIAWRAVPARAEIIPKFEEGGFTFSVSEESAAGKKFFRLLITQTQPSEFDISSDIFVLEGPPRLVIDLPCQGAKKSRQFLLKKDRLNEVRLGAHPDKVRLVFEFSGTELPNHHDSLSGDGKSLAIDIGFFGEPVTPRPPSEQSSALHAGAAAQTPNEPTPATGMTEVEQIPASVPTTTVATTIATTIVTTVPTTERSTTSTRTTTSTTNKKTTSSTTLSKGNTTKAPLDLPISPEELDNLTKPNEPAANPPPPTQPTGLSGASAALNPPPTAGAGNQAVVDGIFFKPIDSPAGAQPGGGKQSSAVMISVPHLSNYGLKTDKPNVYVLVLNNARLAGKHLTLPQFPPDGFSGFEVVMAQEEGQDVIVKIYVDDNVKLSPYRMNDQVWIRAGQ